MQGDADLALALVLLLALSIGPILDLPSTGWTGRRDTPTMPPVRAHVVDVNHAPPGELRVLPGVGPVLADRIAAERDRAPFTTQQDLLRVHGIGPATVSRLAPHVRFRPLETPVPTDESSPPEPSRGR